MNSYLCLKACNFAGAQYLPGDLIPQAKILPERIRTMINQGYVAQTNEPAQMPEFVLLSIPGDGGEVEIGATRKGIVTAFKILTADSAAAKGIVSGETSAQTLELAAAFEERSSVKTVILEKAAAIRASEAQ
jgi:hypothetical protein